MGTEVLGVGVAMEPVVCKENPGIPCLGRAWRIWVRGGSGWREGHESGPSFKDQGSAPETPRYSLAGARQEPAEGAEVARRADAGVDAAEGGCGGLGCGLGLRAMRMESPRVC